ncbi:unnamed protein product [Phytophthora fragariaefolia]|uniref:Unnamed protein product n=1 Tax=Phytophthora fragariaefolia TaxID=1490495 RepID=A0A9W6XK52_9STRA|nr:unnamed protein product [Phytophthora fragariaefolia]
MLRDCSLTTSATINQGLDGEKMIWVTSNELGLWRPDIMDTPRSNHLGMMITTAIPGMIAAPILTCDRGADPNDDRNINSENDHDTDSKDDHNDDPDCDHDTDPSSDRDADP